MAGGGGGGAAAAAACPISTRPVDFPGIVHTIKMRIGPFTDRARPWVPYMTADYAQQLADCSEPIADSASFYLS